MNICTYIYKNLSRVNRTTMNLLLKAVQHIKFHLKIYIYIYIYIYMKIDR